MKVEDQDQLSSEQRQKLKALSKQNKPPSKKKKRKPERVDWNEIMGMNRDTYKRHNGAIRRK